ncbi:hypothetical protein AVEN_109353-1 [Araneus ventricosus]|uniref:Uncharacterized protein n=1 Tax=Araneus ventricosus TaxID=182803 RepID=A0A4Y2GJY8_ARAVE|nr:hypothetical protein AVEN_109353-1 [Araneus ventricosus]
MTRTTPELEPSSPNFSTILVGGRLTHCVSFNEQQVHKHGGSSVESGFESGTHWPQSETVPLGQRCANRFGFGAGRFQVRNPIPLKISRVCTPVAR